MKPLRESLVMTDRQREHYRDVFRRSMLLATDPQHCRPMINIRVPGPPLDWNRRQADPLAMLEGEIEAFRPHLEMGDDLLPSVRVQFGTGQVAAAFGCELQHLDNDLPAVASHPITSPDLIRTWPKASLAKGWYPKLRDWTEVFLENLPDGMVIQHPDIQSPFNTAHLVRGNDILLDFYDDPAAVEQLLDLVTDSMLDIVPGLKAMLAEHARKVLGAIPYDQWFFDWGVLWKGAARISNCSLHMISPAFYRDYVLPRDHRLAAALGGLRVHYCGTAAPVLHDILSIPGLTGLDVDIKLHDWRTLADEVMPAHVVLMPTGNVLPPDIDRLLQGDWPKKRNLVIFAEAPNVQAGRELLARLRASIPY